MMTIIPAIWPRAIRIKNSVDHLFVVADGVQIMARCNIKTGEPSRPTLVIFHGLEGSSESPYVLGLAMKALNADFNVVRVNLRNCGGTMHLTPTLYNAGLSNDVISVVQQLREKFGLEKLFVAGYSLGGNMVLKAAAEAGNFGPSLFAGVCAVSPSLDLPTCVAALEKGFNRFYEQRFLTGLKAKVRVKGKQYPERYDISKLGSIFSIRAFDNAYTSIDAGYRDASEYYEKASALPIISQAEVPILIITSKDDPIVPYHSFQSPQLQAKNITLLPTEHGGHGGFMDGRLEAGYGMKDRFWAENRIVEFCQSLVV